MPGTEYTSVCIIIIIIYSVVRETDINRTLIQKSKGITVTNAIR